MKPVEIHWQDEPEEHNYPAAQSYLTLIFEEAAAIALVEKLRSAPLSGFKAKDILRASALSLLPINNARVERNREKIASGNALSPILLVRDTPRAKVILVDGYHRLCAVYSLDENAMMSCKIV